MSAESLAQSLARPERVGFCGGDRASKNFGNLLVGIALYVVQKEGCAVALRKLADGGLEVAAIEDSIQAQVPPAKIMAGYAPFLLSLGNLIERARHYFSLAKMHQHKV